MERIVRYQFMGNWFLFWLFCFTVVLIPLAVLYLINGTVRLESEVTDAERFATEYRSGKWKK